MRILHFLLIFFVCFNVNAEIINNSKKTSTKVSDKKMDLDKIKNEVVKEPKFSSVSQDQDAADKEFIKNDETFTDASNAHVLEMAECGKHPTKEAILECKKNLMKNNK